MKRCYLYIILLSAGMFFLPKPAQAQQKHETIQMDNGDMIVRLDRRRQAEFESLIAYFGINEDSLFRHGSLGKLEEEGWRIIKVRKNVAVIGKYKEDKDFLDWLLEPIFFDQFYGGTTSPGFPVPVDFGVNSFVNAPTIATLEDGSTLFTLRGYRDAQEVYLSGNFNSWSTQSMPMQRTSDGWEIALPLVPGKYLYKFIADGNWLEDPGNVLGEADGQGGKNSICFVYNHVFQLSGYADARHVYFASSLNDWQQQSHPMQKKDGVWQLPAYVRPGTYTYKFIVDGMWLLDPENPAERPDGSGNFNSVLSIGDSVLFELNGYTDADTVMLAGNFNDWNSSDLGMQRTANGWQLYYVFGPGNYEYKFVVDGNWIPDPDNPRHYTGDDNGNSLFAVGVNYAFVLKGYENATSVSVSGSFNNWSEPGYNMLQSGNEWVCPVYLAPGKHRYKFVVDDVWILDPDNPLQEDNEYHTYNSVLWIEGENAFFFR
ncbi:MAG: hypothetical protein ABR94_07580 [Sphingobacteriales bacterium BACL12 MAG-120802-bin5]|jgi:hypothetical protein|nr:MAG: hypothetical protein ABR94_07580 [Sphingobacteriales bacterium BACL12 MAG-120802-bin5]